MIELLPKGDSEARLYSPAALAYLGDAVFELLVRHRVISQNLARAGRLHTLSKEYVAACCQSRYVSALAPFLTPDEEEIYKRGRNTKTHNTAKNMAVLDYKRATGLETLFGWLYLKGDFERIDELFGAVCAAHDKAGGENGKE